MELPLTGDSSTSSWHVEWLFMLLDLAVVGQPSIFLTKSLAVGLAGLSLCGLVYSVSVQFLTNCLAYCLGPSLASLLRWETPPIDGRGRNLEMDLQHKVQAGVRLWIGLEQKKCSKK